MICPIDQVQMFQLDKLGGGISTDDEYITWEIKVCPICDRKVEEKYICTVKTDEEIEPLLKEK